MWERLRQKNGRRSGHPASTNESSQVADSHQRGKATLQAAAADSCGGLHVCSRVALLAGLVACVTDRPAESGVGPRMQDVHAPVLGVTGSPSDTTASYLVIREDSVASRLTRARGLARQQAVTSRHVFEFIARGFAADLTPAVVQIRLTSPFVKALLLDHAASEAGMRYIVGWGLGRADQSDRPSNRSRSSDRTVAGVNINIVDLGATCAPPTGRATLARGMPSTSSRSRGQSGRLACGRQRCTGTRRCPRIPGPPRVPTCPRSR